MRKIALGVVALGVIVAAFLLGRVSAQDVEPSCEMCPAARVSATEIWRYVEVGRADRITESASPVDRHRHEQRANRRRHQRRCLFGRVQGIQAALVESTLLSRYNRSGEAFDWLTTRWTAGVSARERWELPGDRRCVQDFS